MRKLLGGVSAAICLIAASPIVHAQFEPPIGYYNTASGTGATLKASLNAIIDGHVSISYSNRETGVETLDQDPNNAANCLQVYSGVSVAKSLFPSGGANTEHCWPNSYGIDDGAPAHGDLFNLRVCDENVNSTRGNKYFDDVGGSTPAHAEAPLCRTDSTRWEPRLVEKGDLARAMFYLDVRYEGDGTDGFARNLQLTDDIASITTANNNMGRLSTLVDWHFRDPVAIEEMQRNHKIFTGCGYGAGTFQSCQQNRNPFIDRPEFVWAVFGGVPNNSTLQWSETAPVNGASELLIELPPVIRGAPVWASVPVLLEKLGAHPTTYEISTAGEATCTAVGTRQAFIGGAQGRAMSVGLNSTSTSGLHSGTVTVNNTDLTTAGAGQGSADGDDVVTLSAVVLEHAQPSFAGDADVPVLGLDFGTVEADSGLLSLSFEIHDRDLNGGFTADARITGISPSGDAAVLTTDASIGGIASPGAPLVLSAFLDTANVGTFSATYVFATADEVLPGATARPSLTLTLTADVTPLATCEPRDANCDFVVTLDDIEPFVDLLLETATACSACTGDMNGDTVVDGADIGLFVVELVGP